MKTAQDFRRALGPADEGFENVMRQTLSRLEREEKPMKRKMSLSLALALILIALSLATALAAGLGVFGRLSAYSPKLTIIEQDAQSNDAAISLPAGKNGEIPVDFSVEQSFYDGEELYVSYALRYADNARCAAVPQPEADDAMLIDFWGEERSWYQPILEKLGVWEEMLRVYEEKGAAGCIRDTAYVGDGMRLDDGQYVELTQADDAEDEDGMIGYREFETPLPEAIRGREEITLHATVYRSRIYYLLTQEGLYCWADAERDKTDVPFTVRRSAQARAVAGAQAQFADYTLEARMSQSGGLLICDIAVRGIPESWTRWDSWAQVEAEGLDFVDSFILCADGAPLEALERGGEEDEDGKYWRYVFAMPQSAAVYTLRPVYSLSGERAAEEVRLQ